MQIILSHALATEGDWDFTGTGNMSWDDSLSGRGVGYDGVVDTDGAALVSGLREKFDAAIPEETAISGVLVINFGESGFLQIRIKDGDWETVEIVGRLASFECISGTGSGLDIRGPSSGSSGAGCIRDILFSIASP